MGSHKESEMLKIARATFWWWLEFLAKEGMIELKKTNKYTVITITNWKNYQSDLDSNKTQISTQTEPDKNVKNVKEEPTGAKAPVTARSEFFVDEKQTAEVIFQFSFINPACKGHYGIPAQRKAAENLVRQYGFERVDRVIKKTLPITNALGYFPSITTPNQLWQKWSALEAAILKENDKKKSANEKKGKVYW